MTPKSPRTYNKTEISEVLRVSYKTVNSWVGKGCPVVERRGRGKGWVFDLADVVAWVIEYRTPKPSPSAGTSALSPKDRFDQVRAEREELALALSRKEAFPGPDVRRLFSETLMTLRSQFLSLGPSIAQDLAPKMRIAQAEAIVNGGVHDILSGIARSGDAAPGKPDGRRRSTRPRRPRTTDRGGASKDGPAAEADGLGSRGSRKKTVKRSKRRKG